MVGEVAAARSETVEGRAGRVETFDHHLPSAKKVAENRDDSGPLEAVRSIQYPNELTENDLGDEESSSRG